MFVCSIHEMSPKVTIGCCVDLFPLVQKILNSPYEEYVSLPMTV